MTTFKNDPETEEMTISETRFVKEPNLKIANGLQTVRKIVEMLEKSTQLNEIEYSWEGFRVRVMKHEKSGVNSEFLTIPLESKILKEVNQPIEDTSTPTIVSSSDYCFKSPMVGTVYLSPKPGESPFVNINSVVQEGQTILIIEAMKTMNIIKAPKAGKIKSILVKNEEPVEFGQSLFYMD